MNWLLLVILNAGSMTPQVIMERFPDYQSCKVAATKIKGYLADGIVTDECIQDQQK
jgi:hypothetical protein